MGAQNIPFISILILLILLIPIFILSIKYKLKINKQIAISISRMIIQLSLVGLYLKYIFELNNVIINIIYIIIMICVASLSIIRSCNFNLKKLFFPVFLSIIIPIMLMLVYFNLFVIRIDYLFDAKYLITIGGMLLGNCLSGTIVGLDSFFRSIINDENAYIYRLSLGASKVQAIMPYFQKSMLVSIKPTIASMATMGLVSLPGMMTGQILGGSVPLVAIKYQIAIMISIFIVKYFNILLALHVSIKISFDDMDMLDRNILK